ncbi:ribonuclease HII family protein [Neorickettsia helminthoeca str. Oregon]|uniref:Ribonuclease HII n=1 Tax=Neorickettsia helminthoeca str. Oregon TaxID=1286528 RepID=X5H4I8_9RICK|nr:ribonuclease HII [Neorickettsia helminthoeca]AHX11598.1 ribonuclease HII family protein [Neorickettsia helminthoeca str. Oregon]
MNMQKSIVAGVDEAGRGSIAGPVVAGAVILKETLTIPGDSKSLSSTARSLWYSRIASAAHWGIGVATVREIENMNILEATLLAMERALNNLQITPDVVLIDGQQVIHNVGKYKKVISIIKGDTIHEEIKAASIVAKVARDVFMEELDLLYPQYLWKINKGYGTKSHVQAIFDHGVSQYHRRTFAPVKNSSK